MCEMKISTESFLTQAEVWPSSGRHILAHFDENSIVVYQAYCPQIGHYAAKYGRFGGTFDLNRMSWVKPNFLWMMYRSGWGTKEGQEVTLAIRLAREFWEEILSLAVPSSFARELYESKHVWQSEVGSSEVRLQWDPDHGPHYEKLERRAIQIGLRGEILRRYANESLEIKDISDFVAEQRQHVLNRQLDKLETPSERVFQPQKLETWHRLRLAKEE